MKKSIRILSILMTVVALLSVILPVVSAYAPGGVLLDGDTVTPEGGDTPSGGTETPEIPEIGNTKDYESMGLHFHTGDLTYPKFKIIDKDGNETVYYDETLLATMVNGKAGNSEAERIPAIADGSTVVLMCDLYYPDRGDDVSSYYGMEIIGAKTVNIDFAGYTLLAEHKDVLMNGQSGAIVNIYSSAPGAKFIGVNHWTKGSCVANASSGSVITFGTYGDYPGSNITTYTAAACNVYSSAIVNFIGCDMYRMANDWTGYYCCRSSKATLNLDGVRAFGVVRDLQFHTGNSSSNRGTVITVKNSYMANISTQGAQTGHFFRYITDGNEIHFENTAFQNVSLTVDKYYPVDDGVTPTAVISIGKKCSFAPILPQTDVCHKTIQFPELEYVPSNYEFKHLYVNGTAQNMKYFIPSKTAGSNDYTIADHEDEIIAAPYVFFYKGFEEDVEEVTWDFGGTYTTQLWLKGEEPYPHDMGIPKDTEYVKYTISEPVVGEGFVIYTISPHLYLDFKYNFTYTNTFSVNFYIPVLPDMPVDSLIEDMLIGPNTIKKGAILESEIVVIDGEEYYKVISAIPYDKVTDSLTISLDIYGKSKLKKLFTTSKKVNLPEAFRGFLEGDHEDSFKLATKGVLYAIKDARKNQSTALSGIYALIKEKYETE